MSAAMCQWVHRESPHPMLPLEKVMYDAGVVVFDTGVAVYAAAVVVVVAEAGAQPVGDPHQLEHPAVENPQHHVFFES